jgi:hypothetical protein
MSLALQPLIKEFCGLCMFKKNNLCYQTSASRLYNLNYNLDYIIYNLKQTFPNCHILAPVGSEKKFSTDDCHVSMEIICTS